MVVLTLIAAKSFTRFPKKGKLTICSKYRHEFMMHLYRHSAAGPGKEYNVYEMCQLLQITIICYADGHMTTNTKKTIVF